MEVLDERAVQDVPGGNPASLLRTVSLPIDQILETTTPRANIKESADSMNRGPTGQGGWWGNRTGGHPNNGFNTRHVKDRVDATELWGKPEFDSRRAKNLNNGKRSDEPG